MSTTDHDRGPWDDPGGLGLVVDARAGALLFELIHGESLIACAAWSLGESGVELIGDSFPWEAVVAHGGGVVLHDPACPMTPPAFIAECLARALADEVVVVGTRPVTDTVKRVEHGLVGATVARDSLLAVASPLVVPPGVAATLDARPSDDLATAAADLVRAGHRVVALEAPPEGRRVTSPDDVRVLEALTAAGAAPAGRPRET